MTELNPPARALYWLSRRAWDVAHEMGWADRGEEHWASSALYRAAVVVNGGKP